MSVQAQMCELWTHRKNGIVKGSRNGTTKRHASKRRSARSGGRLDNVVQASNAKLNSLDVVDVSRIVIPLHIGRETCPCVAQDFDGYEFYSLSGYEGVNHELIEETDRKVPWQRQPKHLLLFQHNEYRGHYHRSEHMGRKLLPRWLDRYQIQPTVFNQRGAVTMLWVSYM